MTDKDVIKALGCCSRSKWGDKCAECFYLECDSEKGCRQELCEDAFDLINRQQAEIGGLRKAIDVLDVMISQYKYELKKAKAEAIKEFAERLKANSSSFQVRGEPAHHIVTINGIDYLVKEMVGDAE